MKKLLILLSLTALLLCGCVTAKAPDPIPQTSQPTPTMGAGEAVIPQDGDIVIPIG